MAENNGKINISGSGTIGGGKYADVNVSGSGRIIEPLETESLRVSGGLTAEAPITAGAIRVSGGATLLKDVVAQSLAVSGGLTCGADVTAEKLNVSGSIEIAGRLSGGTVDVAGELSVNGDCEVERFKSRGGFKVGGLLSADVIDVKMYGRCTVGEIGGESVEIRVYRNPIHNMATALGLVQRTVLEVQSVEGDCVLLEHTKARTVRGREVELGDGCEVDLVEYTGDFKQAPGAKVKAARKLEDTPVPQA